MNPYLIVFLVFMAWPIILLLGALVHHVTRPAKPLPARREPGRGTCHVRGCGRVAYEPKVIRRDTLTPEFACVGCRDEGTVLRYWLTDAEMAS